MRLNQLLKTPRDRTVTTASGTKKVLPATARGSQGMMFFNLYYYCMTCNCHTVAKGHEDHDLVQALTNGKYREMGAKKVTQPR